MNIVNNNFYVTCNVILTDFTISTDLVLFIYFYSLPYLLSVDQSYASFLSRFLIFIVYIEAKPHYHCVKIFEPTVHPVYTPR